MAGNKCDSSGGLRKPPPWLAVVIASCGQKAAPYGGLSPAQLKESLEYWADLGVDAIPTRAQRAEIRSALEREAHMYAPPLLHYYYDSTIFGELPTITQDVLEGIPWNRVRQCTKCGQPYWVARLARLEAMACPRCADAVRKRKSCDKKKREQEAAQEALEAQLTEYHECIDAIGGHWPQFSREFEAATAAGRDELLRDARKAKQDKEKLGWKLRR